MADGAGGAVDAGRASRAGRRTVSWCGLVGLAVLVFGCDAPSHSGDSPSPTPSPASRADQARRDTAALRTLLNRRAAAVQRHDAQGFLAVVDPRAGGFRDQQRAELAGLAKVPLASWEYDLRRLNAFPLPSAPTADPAGTAGSVVGPARGRGPAARSHPATLGRGDPGGAHGAGSSTDHPGDPTGSRQPSGATGVGAERRIAAEVELRYRLQGFDDDDGDPVRATEYVTFAEHDGRWWLTSDQDGERSGQRSDVQLWDLGPVRVVRGRHALVLGLGDAASLRGYAARADRAVLAVDRVWTGPWRRRLVVEVPRTLDEMAALLDASAGSYRQIAAITTGEVGGSPVGPADRVVLNPQAFGQLSSVGRAVVVTHEAVHVATRAATTSKTPLWLSEGLADWIAYRDTGRTPRQVAPELQRDVQAGRLPTALPDDADFQAGTEGLAQSYEMAWLACRLIAQRHGQGRLLELYRAVGARRSGVDMVTHRVLGVGLAELTREWRRDLSRELG